MKTTLLLPVLIVAGIVFSSSVQAGPLADAVRRHDLTQTELLLQELPAEAVNAPDRDDVTPLQLAAALGFVDIAKALLNAGASINATSSNGLTALHYAVNKDQAAMVKCLIARKANVNAQTSKGSAPLHWAAHNKNEAIVRILLDGGANV
ncbi:MAG: ankyrin repeat domain-containing protein, partial [bacterium]